MKKIITMCIGFWVLFFLAGCNNIKSSIAFDTFTTEIKSSLPYSQIKTKSSSENVEKIYTTNETWFQSSIIVIKNNVSSGTDSISFANENLATLRTDIKKNGQIVDSESIEISCGDKEIAANISSIEVQKWDKTRYISQIYFVNKENGYIVSHLTEDKSESKVAKKWLENIHCSID